MTVSDLPSTHDVAELRARYRAFMDEHIYPNEGRIAREDDDALALVDELRERAKAEGLWAPHLPPEAGGSGSGFLTYAYLNEEIGRSAWAQYVFGCQAPDAGNAEILHMFGTPEQKEQFLAPLVAGDALALRAERKPAALGTTRGPDVIALGVAWVSMSGKP